jgi:hypothetical protein
MPSVEIRIQLGRSSLAPDALLRRVWRPCRKVQGGELMVVVIFSEIAVE